jgi:hypothetical protein
MILKVIIKLSLKSCLIQPFFNAQFSLVCLFMPILMLFTKSQIIMNKDKLNIQDSQREDSTHFFFQLRVVQLNLCYMWFLGCSVGLGYRPKV